MGFFATRRESSIGDTAVHGTYIHHFAVQTFTWGYSLRYSLWALGAYVSTRGSRSTLTTVNPLPCLRLSKTPRSNVASSFFPYFQ